MERRVEPVRSQSFERIRAAVAARLRPVCQCFPEQEFERLVDRIALVEIKYALRQAEWFHGASFAEN